MPAPLPDTIYPLARGVGEAAAALHRVAAPTQLPKLAGLARIARKARVGLRNWKDALTGEMTSRVKQRADGSHARSLTRMRDAESPYYAARRERLKALDDFNRATPETQPALQEALEKATQKLDDLDPAREAAVEAHQALVPRLNAKLEHTAQRQKAIRRNTAIGAGALGVGGIGGIGYAATRDKNEPKTAGLAHIARKARVGLRHWKDALTGEMEERAKLHRHVKQQHAHTRAQGARLDASHAGHDMKESRSRLREAKGEIRLRTDANGDMRYRRTPLSEQLRNGVPSPESYAAQQADFDQSLNRLRAARTKRDSALNHLQSVSQRLDEKVESAAQRQHAIRRNTAIGAGALGVTAVGTAGAALASRDRERAAER